MTKPTKPEEILEESGVDLRLAEASALLKALGDHVYLLVGGLAFHGELTSSAKEAIKLADKAWALHEAIDGVSDE